MKNHWRHTDAGAIELREGSILDCAIEDDQPREYIQCGDGDGETETEHWQRGAFVS